MSSTKSILAIGPLQFINQKLDSLSAKGYDWVGITPTTRQDLIDALEGLRDRHFTVVLIIAPNLTWGMFNESIFSYIKGDNLKLVTGIGAGASHA